MDHSQTPLGIKESLKMTYSTLSFPLASKLWLMFMFIKYFLSLYKLSMEKLWKKTIWWSYSIKQFFSIMYLIKLVSKYIYLISCIPKKFIFTVSPKEVNHRNIYKKFDLSTFNISFLFISLNQYKVIKYPMWNSADWC